MNRLLVVGFLSISLSAAAQTSYKERTLALYENIYHYYYDSTTGLFTETNNKAADEKPNSYLWPLCALVQAANEMETLQPGKNYLDPVVKAIDQYYSVRHT